MVGQKHLKEGGGANEHLGEQIYTKTIRKLHKIAARGGGEACPPICGPAVFVNATPINSPSKLYRFDLLFPPFLFFFFFFNLFALRRWFLF